MIIDPWFYPMRFNKITNIRTNNNQLEIISTKGTEYTGIRIQYSQDCMYEDNILHEESYSNRWFKKIDSVDVESLSFTNCVFTEDVHLFNVKDVSFDCCYFIGSVELEKINDSRFIKFNTCAIKGSLSIESSSTGSIVIYGTNISTTLFIDSTTVKSSLEIHGIHAGNILINDDHIRGNYNSLLDLMIYSDIKILRCFSDSEFKIEHVECDFLSILDCKMNGLLMKYIKVYGNLDSEGVGTKENLSQEDVSFLFGLDGQYVEIARTNFTNAVSITGIECTILKILECRFQDIFICKDICNGPIPDINDVSPYFAKEDGRYFPSNIVLLDVSGSIFYEYVDIYDIFRLFRADDAFFKGGFHFEPADLFFSKQSTNKNEHIIIGNKIKTLKMMSNSLNNIESHKESERYYIEYNKCKRKEADWPEKIKLYVHQLISNFGTSPIRLLSLCIILVLAFSCLYYSMGISLNDSIYLSGISFFTIGFGEVEGMDSIITRLTTIVEGGLGIATMAYLVTILCRKRRPV